jgi:hypothetical protein
LWLSSDNDCIAATPAITIPVIGASAPPAITASARPAWIMRIASPIAFAELANDDA